MGDPLRPHSGEPFLDVDSGGERCGDRHRGAPLNFACLMARRVLFAARGRSDGYMSPAQVPSATIGDRTCDAAGDLLFTATCRFAHVGPVYVALAALPLRSRRRDRCRANDGSASIDRPASGGGLSVGSIDRGTEVRASESDRAVDIPHGPTVTIERDGADPHPGIGSGISSGQLSIPGRAAVGNNPSFQSTTIASLQIRPRKALRVREPVWRANDSCCSPSSICHADGEGVLIYAAVTQLE